MSLHAEVLSDAQRSVLPVLGPLVSSRAFYLGGGTAVAVYLGHRRSVDLDWFARGKFDDPLVLAQQARGTGLHLAGVQVAPGTLHALIGHVQVRFFEYPYPEISDPSAWPDYSVELASLDDLACMKLGAIAQRGSRKDFVDLHAIALQHKPIRDILELYRRKYSTGDIGHLLVGMTYFDDAEEEPSPVMLSEVSWEDVKRQFQKWAKAAAG